MRQFNGSSDYIKMLTGTPTLASSFAYGTVAAIGVFPGNLRGAILTGQASAGAAISFYVNADNTVMSMWDSSINGPRSIGTFPGNTQVFLAMSKATGSSVPRFHLFNYSTGVWSHSDAAAATSDNTRDVTGWVNGRYESLGGSVLYSEDFTAALSANNWPSPLIMAANGTGYSYSVSGGLGIMTTTGSVGDGTIAATVPAASVNHADVEVEVFFNPNANCYNDALGGFTGICLRQGSEAMTGPDPTNGYKVGYRYGQFGQYWECSRWNGGGYTSVGSNSGFATTAGTAYKAKITIGNNGNGDPVISVFASLAGSAYPGTASATFTDTTAGKFTSAGRVSLTTSSYASAAVRTVSYDSFKVSATAASQSDYLNAHLHLVGYHANTTYSDAEIEASGLHLSMAPWLRFTHAWLYNQAAITQNVIDITGQGADQNLLTGTTASSLSSTHWMYGGAVPIGGIPVIATNAVAEFASAAANGLDATTKVRAAVESTLVSPTARMSSTTSASSTLISITVNPLAIGTVFPVAVASSSTVVTLNTLNIATTFVSPTVSAQAATATQNASHTFTSSGTFTVTHTATNPYGSGTVVRQIVVAAAGGGGTIPVANFTVSANPTQNSPVTFTDTSTNTPTSRSWVFGDGSTSTATNPSHTFTAAGTFNVALTATNASGSNAITKQVSVVATGGGGAAGSSCSTATPDFTVTAGTGAGSLQSIIDGNNVAGKTIRIPAGTYNCGSNILYAVNKNFGGVQIVADPAAIIRGTSGIELYGQILGLTWCGGIIEVNGTFVNGEGVMIDSNRTDKGANGNAGGRITFDNVTIRPQTGTGNIQRNGMAIWGCDLVTVRYCTIHHAGSNAAYGFGGAGSGISIGHGRRLPDAGATRILIDRNVIYNIDMIQNGPSADRNGIILDLLHSGDGQTAPYSDRIIGNVVVSNNEVYNVSGRGIHCLRGGHTDSLVTISNNYVHGYFANDLGQAIGNTSTPVCGIGGYGSGQEGNVLCNNNIVTPYGGHNCYQFDNFDGDGPGVLGSGNTGLPVVFNNSRTNTPPSGFAS